MRFASYFLTIFHTCFSSRSSFNKSNFFPTSACFSGNRDRARLVPLTRVTSVLFICTNFIICLLLPAFFSEISECLCQAKNPLTTHRFSRGDGNIIAKKGLLSALPAYHTCALRMILCTKYEQSRFLHTRAPPLPSFF